MLTDQDIYNIAEWLVYNRDTVLISIGETRDVEHLKHKVKYTLAEHFRKLSVEDIFTAFETEKILLVFDFFYINKRDKKHFEH